MLKIYKGGMTLEVPKGAFKSIYAPSGWTMMDYTPKIPPMGPSEDFMGEGVVTIPPSTENGSEEPQELSEEETLNNMTDVELKQYASLLGIGVKNLKTRKDLMEAIRSHK